MTFQDIITLLEKKYPLELQEEWDKSGFQCGHKSQEIHHIMIGLDADRKTIEEAIHNKCDLLITHHPFLFKSLTLDLESPTGLLIEKIIKNNLCIYSMHTNLDKVSMNSWLLYQLPIKNISKDHPYIVYGHLDQTYSRQDFINLVKKAYDIDIVKYAGRKEHIKTVGIVGGAGSDFYQDACDLHLDAYITGDTKYHVGENVINQETLLVDVGHHVEVISIDKLKEVLEKEVNIPIIAYKSKDYFHYE